jgi:tetraacyldisaccharide-1-P 4'-kinase
MVLVGRPDRRWPVEAEWERRAVRALAAEHESCEVVVVDDGVEVNCSPNLKADAGSPAPPDAVAKK